MTIFFGKGGVALLSASATLLQEVVIIFINTHTHRKKAKKRYIIDAVKEERVLDARRERHAKYSTVDLHHTYVHTTVVKIVLIIPNLTLIHIEDFYCTTYARVLIVIAMWLGFLDPVFSRAGW